MFTFASGFQFYGSQVAYNDCRILTIHIQYTNCVTMENLYSKLSLVDLPGSECLLVEDASGDHVKDFLHVSKSLSA